MFLQGFQYSIEWLEEQIVFHAVEMRRRKLTLTLEGVDLGVPVPAWCLLFEVLPNEDGMPSNMITHETVEVVHRLWELDLSVDIRRSVDLGEVGDFVSRLSCVNGVQFLPARRPQLAHLQCQCSHSTSFLSLNGLALYRSQVYQLSIC